MSVQRLTAWQGCEHINTADGAQTSKQYFGFIVQEDTTISVCSGTYNGAPRNYLELLNLTSKTLKQGALIVVPEGEYISNLTVAGSVIAYK